MDGRSNWHLEDPGSSAFADELWERAGRTGPVGGLERAVGASTAVAFISEIAATAEFAV